MAVATGLALVASLLAVVLVGSAPAGATGTDPYADYVQSLPNLKSYWRFGDSPAVGGFTSGLQRVDSSSTFGAGGVLPSGDTAVSITSASSRGLASGTSNSGALPGGTAAFDVWVKPSALPSGSREAKILDSNDGNSFPLEGAVGLTLKTNSAGEILGQAGMGYVAGLTNKVIEVQARSHLHVGEWTHLTLGWDQSGVLSILVNAKLDGFTFAAPRSMGWVWDNASGWHSIRVGADDGPGYSSWDAFQGTIDEAFIVGGNNSGDGLTLADAEVLQDFPGHHPGGPGSAGSPLSDLETLGGDNPAESCIRCQLRAIGLADPIDASNGNFYESFTDVAVPGRGVPLAFGRTYNSFSAGKVGWLGHGWTTTWSTHLDIASDVVALVQESGAHAFFFKNGSSWEPGPRNISTITHSGTAPSDTWTVVRNHVETLVFDHDGRLTSVTDLNGYTTTLAYSGSSTHPTTVTESTNVSGTPGRSLTLGWTGSYLSSVTDPAGRSTAYAVNTTTGNLDSVTDARGAVTKFTYDSAHRLVTRQSPDQVALHPTAPTIGAMTNEYDFLGRATKQWSATAKSGVSGVNTNPTTFTYGDNETTITDPEGNATRQTYEDGMLASETRGYGTADAGTWTFEFDDDTGGLTTATDPNGNETHTTWYSDCTGLTDCAVGRVHTTNNGVDPDTTFSYDSVSGLVKTVTAPWGTSTHTVTTTNTYDNHVNLASVSTPLYAASAPTTLVDTQVTEFDHGDSAHPEDITTVTDPRGEDWAFTFDSYGNQLTATDPLGHQSSTVYDVGSRPVSTVSPEGNKSGGDASAHRSAVLYDPAGLPLASLGSGTFPVVDAFDRANATLASADTGQTWTATTGTFAVDAGEAKLSSASGTLNMATTSAGSGDMVAGFTSTTAQSDLGVTFRESDSTHFWRVTASPSSNTWNLILRNGATSTTAATTGSGTCCAAGQHVVVRAVGSSIKVYLDGTLKASFSSSSFATATGVGLFAAATGTGRVDQFFAGRAIGGIAATSYDADGNPVAAIDANGNVTTSSYDADDRTLTVVRPDTTQLAYGWGGNGQGTSYTDGAGNTTTYGYDHQGRLASEHRPATAATTYGYAYATHAETQTVTKPDGSTITTTGDAAGRPHTVGYSDSGTADVTYAFDLAGRPLSATPSTGADATWTYDSLGRVTASSRDGSTTGYGYDIAGNETSIAYPSHPSDPVVRHFDDAGRMDSVTDWDDRIATFDRDTNDNLTKTTFGTSSTVANTDEFGYDNSDAMTSVAWKQGTSTLLGSEAYTRPATAAGMVTAITPNTGGATSVGYSSLNQVTSYTGKTTAAYDGADNLTKTHDDVLQVFDAAQRLCWTSVGAASGTCAGTKPANATSYDYDDNGNRTAKTPATSAPSAYTYDQANRLTSATVPSEVGGDGQMVTVAATRLLDTQAPTGVCDPSPCGRLSASTPVDVTLEGQSPLPSSGVESVWATITVINPAANGSLKVNKNGSGPAAAVTMNFDSGVTRNETAIIPLVGGDVTIESTTAVDVLIDVSGYFQASGSTADTYHGSSPTRLVDTRSGSSTGTCPTSACSTPAANATTLVAAAGSAGLPGTGLHAAVISLTVLTPGANGQIKVSPGTGGASAGAISYAAGKTMNEMIIAPVDSNGRLTVFTSTSVDFLIDVSGYFTNPVAGNLGLAYQPVTATNLVTSTTPTGPCLSGASAPYSSTACGALVGSTRQRIQIAGQAGIPLSAGAVVGSLSVSNPAADGFIRLNPTFSTGMGLGGDATIDLLSGKTRNSTFVIPIKTDGTIEIAGSVGADWTLDISGYMTQPLGTWTYQYDATGIRSSKTSPAGTTTDFTYTGNGGLPLLLEQETGGTTTSIIYGPGGVPLEQITGSDGVWLHIDQLGSIRRSTAATTSMGSVGTQIATQNFDAYGSRVVASGSNQSLLGFAGEYSDSESGFQYLRARYVDASTGQFLTVDALVTITGAAYAYTAGDPINLRDPSGLNQAPGEGALSSREILLGSVSNRGLWNLVDQIYREGASIGDGGTADALRSEVDAGLNSEGTFTHFDKACNRIQNLTRLIAGKTKYGELNPSDELIADSLLSDLVDARAGADAAFEGIGGSGSAGGDEVGSDGIGDGESGGGWEGFPGGLIIVVPAGPVCEALGKCDDWRDHLPA